MVQTSWYNIGVGLIVALGSFTYGFGFASFATSIGQPGFYQYFNLSDKPQDPRYDYTNSVIGAVNALFFFGAVIGALGGGPFADHFGRRMGLFVGSIVSIIGGALTSGSVAIAMLIVVRILQGCGLGALATITPIYLAEASTPSKRGLLTGLHGFFLVGGYNISAWVGLGCFFSKNLTFQWRGPLAFTCVAPVFLAIGCFFIPESPRWLIKKGRVDDAWAVIQKLHHDKNDHDDLAAREELYQMKAQIEYESQTKSGYWTILSTRSYQKRAFLSCFVQLAANSTGALVINYYSVVIYTNLGLKNYLPLLMYAIFTLIGACGNLFSLLTIDRTGRRLSLLIGFTGCLIALIVETAMIGAYVDVPHPDTGGQKTAVVALMFFVFFYGLFIDAASFIYSSEVYPTQIRARGVAMATATYFIACITYVTPGATAIANIGWRYFLVFVCLTVVTIIVIFFFFPETKCRSLEELGELFGDKVVVRVTEAAGATEEDKTRMDQDIKTEVVMREHVGADNVV